MTFLRTTLAELRSTSALALPMVAGQLSQILMGVTDSAMLGHVGRVPLAASAFAGTVFGLFFIAGTGLLVPVSVLVARARGSGRLDACLRPWPCARSQRISGASASPRRSSRR